jgi:SulP family sulfate permease
MRAAPYVSVLWGRLFPFLHWWPLLNRQALRADLMAGLTNAVVVFPQGVAFATIAGLPPAYGLYTAMVPPVVAALFGSSRHLISGPTTALSIVVFATINPLAEPGSPEFIKMAITMTFLAGVYQLALGLARMGALVNFVSHSVIVGFTAGAAILIVTSQLNHYFGVQIPHGDSFHHKWHDFFSQTDKIQWHTATVATVTLASAIVLLRWRPRWPAMLLAMVIGSVAALGLGGEAAGIKLIGALSQDLPPLSLPDYSLDSLQVLGSGALAIALLGLVEAVSIARSIGLRSGQRIDGNQEFIGQGLANIVGSFFSSYASSGSFTRSGLNYTAGAITPLAAIFAAIALALIVLLVAPLIAYLPIAAMAGVIVIVAYRLIDVQRIVEIARTSKRETAVLVTTFLATLFVELEFAIYVGVMLSLIFYLMRTSHPLVHAVAPDPRSHNRQMIADPNLPSCPQLKIVRIDGSLFFGAVDHVQSTLQAFSETYREQKHLLLIASGINFIDVAGAEMLVHEARRRRELGGGLYIARMKRETRQIFTQGRYLEQFGKENVFASKAEAIATIFKRLDRERCERCRARIFTECLDVPYKEEGSLPATTGHAADEPVGEKIGS